MKKGDFVALFAKPIGRWMDFVFNTDFEGCAGCKARRELLNNQTIWQLLRMLWSKVSYKISHLFS
jgi:hypothetical protein